MLSVDGSKHARGRCSAAGCTCRRFETGECHLPLAGDDPGCDYCDHGRSAHRGVGDACQQAGCACRRFAGPPASDQPSCAYCAHGAAAHRPGGPCTEAACDCTGFMGAAGTAPQAMSVDSVRPDTCQYCDHDPGSHPNRRMCKQPNCNCNGYVGDYKALGRLSIAESLGATGRCEFCDHPAAVHTDLGSVGGCTACSCSDFRLARAPGATAGGTADVVCSCNCLLSAHLHPAPARQQMSAPPPAPLPAAAEQRAPTGPTMGAAVGADGPAPSDQCGSVQRSPHDKSRRKCAIEECIEAAISGQEYCSFEHYAESQRRKAMLEGACSNGALADEQLCAFPDCKRPKWPFFDYCGRTHALEAQRLGYTVKRAADNRPRCMLPGCDQPAYIDERGIYSAFCSRRHMSEAAAKGIDVSAAAQRAGAAVPSPQCLLPGCTCPVAVDRDGNVADFCSVEHQQEAVAKNITPAPRPGVRQRPSGADDLCLMPGCQNKAYVDPSGRMGEFCSKRHRDEAKQKGLQLQRSTKQSKLPKCALPECSRRVFVESDGRMYGFCGKQHAQEGKRRHIVTASAVPDDGSAERCAVPGCKNPQYKESEYCNKTHMAEAKEKGYSAYIRAWDAFEAEVRKQFESTSGGRSIVKLTRSEHAWPPSGKIYKNLATEARTRPKDQRKTIIAFHGTAAQNADGICANGFDASRRARQVYGPGEYFGLAADISLGYCQGGNRILICELLLGKEGVDHQTFNNFIVMKDPKHELPRGWIEFA